MKKVWDSVCVAQRLSPDGEDGGLYFAQVGKGAEKKACRAQTVP
jgi:hypothetical protein